MSVLNVREAEERALLQASFATGPRRKAIEAAAKDFLALLDLARRQARLLEAVYNEDACEEEKSAAVDEAREAGLLEEPNGRTEG